MTFSYLRNLIRFQIGPHFDGPASFKEAGACTGEDQMTNQPGGLSDTKLGESGNITLREGIPYVGTS
jgi:hypothetical protein